MDQRVSPVATTWVAGNWPNGAGAGAACVVSCAASAGASPASSPATRASRAARSERQIVVLLIKGLRERVERFRLAPRLGRHLGRGFCPRVIARAPPPSPPPTPTARRQEEHFPRDDLVGVARLLLPILPGPVLDAPLHVDPVALLHVLLGQIRELEPLVIPAHDP